MCNAFDVPHICGHPAGGVAFLPGGGNGKGPIKKMGKFQVRSAENEGKHESEMDVVDEKHPRIELKEPKSLRQDAGQSGASKHHKELPIAECAVRALFFIRYPIPEQQKHARDEGQGTEIGKDLKRMRERNGRIDPSQHAADSNTRPH